jgi:hypothetical protein
VGGEHYKLICGAYEFLYNKWCISMVGSRGVGCLYFFATCIGFDSRSLRRLALKVEERKIVYGHYWCIILGVD